MSTKHIGKLLIGPTPIRLQHESNAEVAIVHESDKDKDKNDIYPEFEQVNIWKNSPVKLNTRACFAY